jgi:thioredoxin 2
MFWVMDEKVVYPCAHCGRPNRLLLSRIDQQPRCGHCKQAVFPDKPVTVTDATWSTLVLGAPLPVLVDFWAPWCGPCRAIAPMLEQVAGERAGRLVVAKLNVDENQGTAGGFNVQAIPTMIIFRNGQVVDQVRGAVPRPTLDSHLARLGV